MVALELGNDNWSGEFGTKLRSKSFGDGLRVENSKEPDPANAYLGGVGLVGTGVAKGVAGHCNGESAIGVFGQNWHSKYGCGVMGFGPSMGVAGYATKEDINSFAIFGGGSNKGYAGLFAGKVRVFGELTKGGGGFCIDHPLDPENRYLQHSFVESSERLNVYSGTVVTGSKGTAVVELPDYFEALNADFRYQLTVIGDFCQTAVSEEIHDNRFTIATERPEVKVSWQVTGTRQDNYARALPLMVEEYKGDEERGKYLHPEAWGKPREEGVIHEQLVALEQQATPQEPGNTHRSRG